MTGLNAEAQGRREEEKVVVEVKASETNHTLYNAQTLTYLRLTGLKLGLYTR